MRVSASIKSEINNHVIVVKTNENSQEINISPKLSGYCSSVNGGEFLMLALATCFCNDIYREAGKRNLVVKGVEVVVMGEFGAEGQPGYNFQYKANVIPEAPAKEIEELITLTDQIAEIHNTLRKGLSVTLIR